MIYCGSKKRIASDIVAYIHSYIIANNIQTYIEPFVGGANIIEHIQCKNKIGSDINKELIALYTHLQNGGELPALVTREKYNDVRTHWRLDDGKYEDWYIGVVGFLMSFNGIEFCTLINDEYVDKRNGNNRIRSMYTERCNSLLSQMSKLKDVKFINQSYDIYNTENCLYYMDPPYAGTYSYGRNRSKKNVFDSDAFWNKCRELSKNNIVLISEYNAPDDFVCIWSTTLKVQCNPYDDNNNAEEKLFIHESRYEKVDFDF